MERPLKDTNKFSLYVIMVANFAFFYLVVQTNSLVSGHWLDTIQAVSRALPAGLGLILTGVLNAQLSPEMKSRIVFMRWRNSLPGCEGFSRYAREDLRIDLPAIERLHGPLPNDARQQNALWYRLFKSVSAEPSVVQAHRSFLFTRDYACISLMLACILGTLGFFYISSKKVAIVYMLVLLVQFLLVSQAARNHGRRLVTTVLAIKAADA